MMNYSQVFDLLTSEGYLSAEEQDRIARNKGILQTSNETPWFIRLLLGFSAWMAAAIVLPFLLATVFMDSSGDLEWRAIIVGTIFCITAIGIRIARSESTFAGQLALVLCIAGEIMLIGGLAMEVNDVATIVMLTIAIQCLLIWVFQEPIHRFLSPLVIVAALVVWGAEAQRVELIHVVNVVLAIGMLLLWEYEDDLLVYKEFVRPTGYALPVALFGLLSLSFIREAGITLWWLSGVGLFIALLGLEYRLLRDAGVSLLSKPALALFCGTLVLLIPAIGAPGILAALFVLALGFRRNNRLLIGLASLFLVFFIGRFYYDLETTLLIKSFQLAGTGLVLLALRYGILYIFAKPEANHETA